MMGGEETDHNIMKHLVKKLQMDGYIFCLPGSALKEFFTVIVIDVFLRPCKMV